MPKPTKSPPEKKKLSLKKDRRNTYGENSKSSRKNIAKSKALAHRKVRRRSKTLEDTWGRLDDGKAEAHELSAVTPRLQKGRFRKSPDEPLGKVVKTKLATRIARQGFNKKRKANKTQTK